MQMNMLTSINNNSQPYTCHVGSWSTSTQLILFSLLSVRVSRKDQFLVLFYLYTILISTPVSSLISHWSVGHHNVCWRQSTFHFFCHLWKFTPASHRWSCLSVNVFQSVVTLSIQNGVSPHLSSWSSCPTIPKSLNPVISCHLKPLHQLPQHTILVSSLIRWHSLHVRSHFLSF